MNTEFVRGLRALADWYEERPGMLLPLLGVRLDLWTRSSEEFRALARTFGAAEKVGGTGAETWFALRKQFGPITLDLNTERKEDIIEWDCGPILA